MFPEIRLFIALLIFFSPATPGETTQHDQVLGLTGEEIGGDFTLHSSSGDFALRDLRGKVVLLYFGYTKCPDVCPTSLAILAQALNQLSDDELSFVQGVFVTVDPKRDNFDVLDEYVSYFHPKLIGITGSEGEIAKVAKLYGAQYAEVEIKGSEFGYAVDHSAIIYLITPEGKLRFLFPHQTPSTVILEAIRYVLEKNLTQ